MESTYISTVPPQSVATEYDRVTPDAFLSKYTSYSAYPSPFIPVSFPPSSPPMLPEDLGPASNCTPFNSTFSLELKAFLL